MKIELTETEVKRILNWFPKESGALAVIDNAIRLKLEGHRAMPSAVMNNFDEFWGRHHKRNGKVYQIVLQVVIGKSDKIDWERFQKNHPLFCQYWDRRGWQYCPETLIDWIDNGCNAPPPEPETAAEAKMRRMAGE